MWATNMLPVGANTFQIYLDPNYPGEFRGVAYGSGALIPLEFSTISRLIVQMDDVLDRNEPGIKCPRGDAPSYIIEVLFRQNYSWQGRLRWPAAKKEAVFHSVLELIFLLETDLAS